jgi:hypothetical protein
MKARTVIEQLLSKNAGMRSDPTTLKNIPYFDGFDWDDLLS